MSGAFANYFNRSGRQWPVYLQAEGEYRTKPEDIAQFYVRNEAGIMAPLSALTSVKESAGPESRCDTTFTAPRRLTATLPRDTAQPKR